MSENEKKEIHLVGGPTASGKSALALELAHQSNGVIINADAMQIYCGLPILTAQPDETSQKAIQHNLYGHIAPNTPFSTGKWLEQAVKEIESALSQDKTPVFVGGTGLYFKVLTDGLAEIPPIPPEKHQESVDKYRIMGSEAFRNELSLYDQESAERLKPNDQLRLVRAYEVSVFTGHPLSYWHAHKQIAGIGERFTIKRHLILPDRAELYRRCDDRFLNMMEQGALQEVELLASQNLSADMPAMKILGVPDLSAYLKGQTTLDAAIAKSQQATRNYAKRQVTWFRNQWPEDTQIHT